MDKINDIEKCMTPGGNVKEIEINSKCLHHTRIITKDYQKKQILDRCANCNHRNGIWTPSSVGWESLCQLMMWQPEE
ncbi:hypothetical protein [Spiroplasma melliferum]|uniref:Uncharacterized protein n=2 Tax=Spiroplasma melliferum TaxID=2134 RepID=A0AAI9T4I6_SPIME|nr:hypothetical protein [Spiroplasma melliferum]KAI93119.1 hypothetical protein SPM_000810 [Spiroplasma melliferum KC3]QCO24235.1 hypothetical protein SRED_002723 [Spiroplasma melliferum]